jgi:hypothetical protein
MKSIVIATLLGAATLAATAQTNNGELYEATSPAAASVRSRAEVITETRAAQLRGAIAKGEMWVIESPQRSSSSSRAQVQQEMQGLRRSGKLPANGEITGG